MGAFVWMYQSTTIWYPTLLANLKQQPLAFLLLLNAGGMIGSIAFGWLSEKWGGRRGAATRRHGRRHPVGAALLVLGDRAAC